MPTGDFNPPFAKGIRRRRSAPALAGPSRLSKEAHAELTRRAQKVKPSLPRMPWDKKPEDLPND